jgi:hypothetical protein
MKATAYDRGMNQIKRGRKSQRSGRDTTFRVEEELDFCRWLKMKIQTNEEPTSYQMKNEVFFFFFFFCKFLFVQAHEIMHIN